MRKDNKREKILRRREAGLEVEAQIGVELEIMEDKDSLEEDKKDEYNYISD